MHTLVRRLGIGLFAGAIALAAVPASAQEISLGYQFQSISIDGDSEAFPLGFNIDVAGPISPNLDIVGQLDWSRKSESEVIFGSTVEQTASFTTFGGGIRWSSRTNPGLTPYVQALFGVTRGSFGCEVAGLDCDDFVDDTSSTDPMFQIGGGVAIPMGAWSAVGQVDYRRFFFEGEGANSLRFVAGVRLGIR